MAKPKRNNLKADEEKANLPGLPGRGVKNPPKQEVENGIKDYVLPIILLLFVFILASAVISLLLQGGILENPWYWLFVGFAACIVVNGCFAEARYAKTIKLIAGVGMIFVLVMVFVYDHQKHKLSAMGKTSQVVSATMTPVTPPAPAWWADEVRIEKNDQVIIGEVKANDQLRSLSVHGHTILRDGHNPNLIQGGVDMVTTFKDFGGNRIIKFSGNGQTDTVVRYKIIRR